MWPAVPTVSGTTHRPLAGRSPSRARSSNRGCDLVDLAVCERAAVEEEAAVADDADHRRVARAQRGRERLLDGARERLELRERQRPAADARDGLLDVASDGGREPLRARTDDLRALLRACARRGSAAGVVEGERERRLERGERRACRRAARAGAGGGGDARRGRRARRRFRPAGRRGACRRRSRRGRRRPRAPRAASAPRRTARTRRNRGRRRAERRDAARRRRRLRASGRSTNPTSRKFDWWTRRSARRVLADRALVVGCARAVRRRRPRRAARPTARGRPGSGTRRRSRSARRARRRPRAPRRAPRGRAERRRRCCSRRGGLGARQPPHDRGEMVLPRPARAGLERVLEVRVAARDLRHARERLRRERRAAEVRVDDDRPSRSGRAGAKGGARRRAPNGAARRGRRGRGRLRSRPAPARSRSWRRRPRAGRPPTARARPPTEGRAASSSRTIRGASWRGSTLPS